MHNQSQKYFLILNVLFLFSEIDTWFTILPLKQVLEENPKILYKKCFGEAHFSFEPFGLSPLVPDKGYFKECFILEIPQGQGKLCGKEGYVFFNNNTFIQEMVWAERADVLQQVPPKIFETIQKIPGRVAIIGEVPGDFYSHFLNEILARLAMLEMHNVAYDWLYVGYNHKFIREGLQLWGIDESKIIFSAANTFCIQADTLILPSLVLNTNYGFKHTGLHCHPYTLKYVKDKLLLKIKDKVNTSKFCKKIFISRRDAPYRKIINEDEVYELFKARGFERYDTGKMSFSEQVALFAQAEMVAGEHGAGLTNILFCKEGTVVIEIFQAIIDSSFWFLSQVSKLKYIPIQTLNVDPKSLITWSDAYNKAQFSQVKIPLDRIKETIHNLVD